MSTIVTRAGKGSALSYTEVDNNFTNLNTDKLDAATAAFTTLESTFATLCSLTPDHLFVSKTIYFCRGVRGP